MGLNIVSQSDGNFDNWIKFNSKAGRFYMKSEAGEVEVSPTSFIADLGAIKTGWLMFAAGQAPDRVWDASLTQPAAKPSENHKRGFSLRLFSKATFNGIVELSSSSMHLCGSINDLYDAFEAGRGTNPGMVPVVKFTGCQTMKDAKGMNYKPNFVIEKWVPRPADFDAVATPAAPQYPQAPVANQQTQQVQPPAPPVASVSEF